MAASETLTIQLTPEVSERLEHLAAATHRTRSFLAAEAISTYLAREAEIIEAVEHGLADLRGARLVPHDEAMARLEATIAAVERGER
jgi:predicted transcriptional regulator